MAFNPFRAFGFFFSAAAFAAFAANASAQSIGNYTLTVENTTGAQDSVPVSLSNAKDFDVFAAGFAAPSTTFSGLTGSPGAITAVNGGAYLFSDQPTTSATTDASDYDTNLSFTQTINSSNTNETLTLFLGNLFSPTTLTFTLKNGSTTVGTPLVENTPDASTNSGTGGGVTVYEVNVTLTGALSGDTLSISDAAAAATGTNTNPYGAQYGGFADIAGVEETAAPEPSAFALMGMGLAALIALRGSVLRTLRTS